MITFSNLDGETIVYTEGDAPKRVDAQGDVVVIDPSASVGGSTLTISITANKNAGEDLLGVDYETGVAFEEGFVEGGAVYVDGRYVGYVGLEGGAPGEAIVVVFDASATADDVARLIQAVTYANIDNDDPSPLTRTLTFHLESAEGEVSSANVFIDVVAVLDINDPPVVDMDPATEGTSAVASYVEQGTPIQLAPNATVVDSDSPTINGGSLVIAVTGANAFDQLGIQDQGLGFGQIKIEDSSVAPDGQPQGVLSASGTVFATFKGGKDGTPLTITFLPDASVADAPGTSLTALYRAITYSSTSEFPPATRNVSFTVDDGGGTENGGNPIAATSVTVNLSSVNDAPVVDLNGAAIGNGATLAYTENQVAVRIAPAATVTDDNPAKFNGGSLTISLADSVATDQLTIGAGGAEDVGIEWGIGGVGSDSGAITLGGSILATFTGGKNGAPLIVNFFPEGSLGGFTTLATVQAILRSISYSSTSDNPTTDPRTINYTLKDGQGTANGGIDTTIATATLNTTRLPDAPVARVETLSIVNLSTTQFNISQLLANDTDADGNSFTVTGVSLPSGGTVAFDAGTGIVTFAHTGGAASFRYTIEDSTGLTSFATVTLNRAPVAVTDTLGATMNAPVIYSPFNLIGNDTDGEGNPLTITGVSGAVNGTVVLNANGTVTFTPNSDYSGAASFQYTITDSFGTTTGTANVNVRTSNAAPTAVNDTVTVTEDNAVTTTQATLVGNDVENDGGTKVIQSVGNATGGTVVLLSNGSVRFTPNANFNGEAGYDYVLSDSQGGTSTAHVRVNVTAANDPPVANVNTLATNEDTPLVIPWATLLGNDTDVDGDTLSITAVSAATNGTVSINTTNKTVTFTPAVDYSTGRSFNFRYTISDGKGGTSSAQVNVNVTPVNDAPSGTNRKVGLLESGTHVFTDVDFSTGFSDSRDVGTFGAGANAFAGVVITTLPGSGTLFYDADGAGGADPVAVTPGLFVSKANLLAGKLSYVADPDEIVNPTFTFQVTDDGGTANGGIDADTTPNTMELALTPLNDAPQIDLNGAAAGATTATYSIGSSGAVIAPNATLRDDNPNFANGTLTVSIGSLSFGDVIFVSETVPGIMLLGSQIYYNDVMIGRINSSSGNSIQIGFFVSANSEAVQAVIRSIAYDGSGASDTDPRQIIFNLTDGAGTDNGGEDATSVEATVVFNNAPVPDSGFTFAGNEDAPIVIAVADLLANAYDLDGDAVSISAVYSEGYGTPVLSADGATITFTPQANYSGPASFSYDLRDAKGGITHVVLQGNVAPVADNPVAGTDTLSAQQGVPTVFAPTALLINDVDPDLAGAIVITSVTSGSGGTVVLNPDGSVTFTPDGSLLGVTSFTYTIADGNGGTATGTANVTVKKLLAASEDVTTIYTVADLFGTAVDANGLPLTLASVQSLTGGIVVLNGDGTVSFTSNEDFNGRANFNFVLNDGTGNDILGGALVDVAPTPDNPVVNAVNLYAPKDQSFTYTPAQLLGDSYDPDGTPLAITAVSAGSNGSAVLNADGSVTFTATPGYEGSASFGFTVSDGNGGSTSATANLGVYRSLVGTEDQESFFTFAQIAGAGSLTQFNLGFEFNGGSFSKLGSTIYFTPDPDFFGLASTDYSVRINNVLTTGRFVVNVTPVNDAPIGQSNSATIAEDGSYVFTVADFPFFDVEGHALASVVIATLPTSGTLYLDSDGPGGAAPVAIAEGAAISLADIVAGHLTYAAAGDANGNDIGSFTFKVRDAGGTANGGVDTDASPNSFTLNVTAVNDAPVFSAAAALPAYVEQQGPLQVAGDVTLSDDQANLAGGALSVTIMPGAGAGDVLSVAEDGGITVSGTNVSYNGVVFATIASASATAFTFQLDADAIPAAVEALAEAIRFANASDIPEGTTREIRFTLNDGGGTANGGHNISTFLRTFAVTPVDDGPIAANNSGSTSESATVRLNVLGNDLDPDGGPVNLPAVALIGGNAATVGVAMTLASGATAMLNADGTITYNPNGKFNTLISPTKAAWTGATNTSALDSFTYTLTNGSSATVNVTVNGIDSTEDAITGTAGNDIVVGYPGNDFFNLSKGGDDRVSAGQGDDIIYFGAAFTAADIVKAGLGIDVLALQGNYSLAFGAGSLLHIEFLVLMSSGDASYGGQGSGPFSYAFTTADGNVAPGAQFTVQGNRLGIGDTLSFDGSVETDGSFRLFGGSGNDVLKGGAMADVFSGGVGADTITGNGGADIFMYRAVGESTAAAQDVLLDFGAGDRIDLRGIDANLATPADTAFSFIGSDAFHQVAGELRLDFSGGVWSVQADVNGDGTADLMLTVHAANGHVMGISDFML